MVEPKVEDGADASEKKAPTKRWNKKKNKLGIDIPQMTVERRSLMGCVMR